MFHLQGWSHQSLGPLNIYAPAGQTPFKVREMDGWPYTLQPTLYVNIDGAVCGENVCSGYLIFTLFPGCLLFFSLHTLALTLCSWNMYRVKS